MRTSLPSGTPAVIHRPSSGVPRRSVVVVPDVHGLSERFDELTKDLAQQHDWEVGTFELFPGREMLTFQERLETGLAELTEEQVLGDMASLAQMMTEPVAALGFCIGGALAMRALTLGVFDRVVSCYGMVHLPPPWQGGGKGDPLAAVGGSEAPVLSLVGSDDQFIPAEQVDELESAGAEVVRYEGAAHGFIHDPSQPYHHPEHARDAWGRIASFLQRDR